MELFSIPTVIFIAILIIILKGIFSSFMNSWGKYIVGIAVVTVLLGVTTPAFWGDIVMKSIKTTYEFAMEALRTIPETEVAPTRG